MHPQAFSGAEIRNLIQWVDGSGVGCAGVCRHAEGHETLPTVSHHSLPQNIHGQLEILVRLDFAQLKLLEAQDFETLRHRRMRLI